jgi:3alpha(or 20beta)-hydroxysteroid dehydrogenase
VKRFEGKRAVVTGAAGGIGRATAARLLSEGADVVLVDRSAEQLDSVRAELAVTAPTTVAALAVDVTSATDVERLASYVDNTLGGLDVLLNNAGVPGPTKPMIDCSEEEFRQVLDVNLLGSWRLIKAMVPLMPAGAVVVNTASTVGIKAAPLVSLYGASKQALLSLTRSAAVELASRGVRVNAVCPGTVETAMTEHVERHLNPADPGKVHDRFVRAAPLRRYATPDEIAALFAYLASDEAAYVTGAAYLIDGGATIL